MGFLKSLFSGKRGNIIKKKDTSHALREALCNAAEAEDILEIKRLLVQGANPNYETGPKCASPLLLAAHKGCTEIVRVLISSGANINKQNTDGLTPVMAAAMNGHIAALRVLYENNADINLQTAKDRHTALMLTVMTKQKESLKVLLEMGANAALRNARGDTALDMAQDKPEITHLLAPHVKDHIDDRKGEKIQNIKELEMKLCGSDFRVAFESLFCALRDEDPEIRAIAAVHLAENHYSVENLISIYKTSIDTDPSRAVLAGRVLGRKLSRGKSEMISEDISYMVFGIRIAFTAYACPHCDKVNPGIPVPSRYLSFFGQEDDKNCDYALPILCDFCGKGFYLCWDHS